MMSSRPDELGETLSLTYHTLIQYELCVLYILALHTLLHCIVYPQPFCVCVLKITQDQTFYSLMKILFHTAERVCYVQQREFSLFWSQHVLWPHKLVKVFLRE